jgi:hypothetical protein
MRWALVVGAAFVAVGCGGREPTANKKVRAEIAKVQTTCVEGVNCGGGHFRPFRKCTHVSRGFRACTTFFVTNKRSTIYRRVGRDWVRVRGPLSHRAGWWRRVLPAPDRRTLLAQWSGECEVQSTYAVSVSDGKAAALFAGRSSGALGWTRDGLGRVRLTDEIWRGKTRLLGAGIYLVDPVTLAVRRERAEPAHPGC